MLLCSNRGVAKPKKLGGRNRALKAGREIPGADNGFTPVSPNPVSPNPNPNLTLNLNP